MDAKIEGAALVLATTLGGLAVGGAVRAEAPASLQRADTRARTQSVIETLSARLLSSHSATAVLEAWCAERGLADDPRLVAVRVAGPDKPASGEQRLRLALRDDEPVRYRRVRLTCGSHVLSEADNWYVPGRLTPEMNAALATTQAPFGRVVRALAPTRRNLGVVTLWPVGEDRLPGPDDKLFSVSAVLYADGVPFCEVAETYTGAVLARGDR